MIPTEMRDPHAYYDSLSFRDALARLLRNLRKQEFKAGMTLPSVVHGAPAEGPRGYLYCVRRTKVGEDVVEIELKVNDRADWQEAE